MRGHHGQAVSDPQRAEPHLAREEPKEGELRLAPGHCEVWPGAARGVLRKPRARSRNYLWPRFIYFISIRRCATQNTTWVWPTTWPRGLNATRWATAPGCWPSVASAASPGDASAPGKVIASLNAS